MEFMKKKNKSKRLTEEMIKKILKMYDKGKSMSEIARLIGCSRNTVKYWL